MASRTWAAKSSEATSLNAAPLAARLYRTRTAD